MYCIQLLSGLTSFKSISVNPYFWPENTYDVKLDELEALVKPDKLKVLAKLDKLKALLPAEEAP
jgi:hypothetical protein